MIPWVNRFGFLGYLCFYLFVDFFSIPSSSENTPLLPDPNVGCSGCCCNVLVGAVSLSFYLFKFSEERKQVALIYVPAMSGIYGYLFTLLLLVPCCRVDQYHNPRFSRHGYFRFTYTEGDSDKQAGSSFARVTSNYSCDENYLHTLCLIDKYGEKPHRHIIIIGVLRVTLVILN